MSRSTAHGTTQLLVRDYRPGDEISVNATFNRIFRKDRTLREWEWKFGRQAGESHIMVAVDTSEDERVVIHYGGRELRFWHAGREVRAGHVMDSFASREPEVVHGRWFESVREAFLEKHGESGYWSIIFGFPGNRALRHGRLTNHFVNACPLKVWRAPGGVSCSDMRGWKVVEGVSDRAADELWQRAKVGHPPCVVRDAAWLKQRFTTRPMRDGAYVILSVRRRWSLGASTEAWGVFLVRKDGILWADCLWDGAHPEALWALWHRATSLQPDLPLEFWEGPAQRLSQVLRSQGWTEVPWPDAPFFSYRAYSPLTYEELDRSPIYITAGDTDLV